MISWFRCCGSQLRLLTEINVTQSRLQKRSDSLLSWDSLRLFVNTGPGGQRVLARWKLDRPEPKNMNFVVRKHQQRDQSSGANWVCTCKWHRCPVRSALSPFPPNCLQGRLNTEQSSCRWTHRTPESQLPKRQATDLQRGKDRSKRMQEKREFMWRERRCLCLLLQTWSGLCGDGQIQKCRI